MNVLSKLLILLFKIIAVSNPFCRLFAQPHDVIQINKTYNCEHKSIKLKYLN